MTEKKVELTETDIAVMLQIIDAGSERGAFKGNELLEIGLLRKKLVEYHEQIKK